MFKVDNKTSERHQCYCSGVFIVDLEHMSNLFLMFLMSTSNKYMVAGLSVMGATALNEVN